MLYITHLSSFFYEKDIKEREQNYPIIWLYAKKAIITFFYIMSTWRAMSPLLIRAGSDARRAEHALYSQGHADLHVQLILIQNDAARFKISIHISSLPKMLPLV